MKRKEKKEEEDNTNDIQRLKNQIKNLHLKKKTRLPLTNLLNYSS